MAARAIQRNPEAFRDGFGRPYQEPPPGFGRGWLIHEELHTRNPLLTIPAADIEEAYMVLRLWGWTRGTILVRGLAPGSFGPLPGGGGVADQPAALLDAFEELQTEDLADLKDG